MKLVQNIEDGFYDIIGDIHGELQALENVLKNLGYDDEGNHPQNRKLIFVGDFVDRGENSVGVIKKVKCLVENNNAKAVIGNHEFNLLNLQEKDGAGWFFSSMKENDFKYEPYVKIKETEKKEIYDFLKTLPLVLHNDKLRIVHAAWDDEMIDAIKDMNIDGYLMEFKKIEDSIKKELKKSGLYDKYKEEEDKYCLTDIKNKIKKPLKNIAMYKYLLQAKNPFKIILSGHEGIVNKPFYAGGQWRFIKRLSWWEKYEGRQDVVIGHYWRKVKSSKILEGFDDNMFGESDYNEWIGKNKNVFCVDYCVGARYKERKESDNVGDVTKLAALRWPENVLFFDTGEILETKNYKKENLKTVKASGIR